jgi:hypothetical protein
VEPTPSPTPTASPVPVATGPVDPGAPGSGPGPLVALLSGAVVTGIGVFGLRRAARRPAQDADLEPGRLAAG